MIASTRPPARYWVSRFCPTSLTAVRTGTSLACISLLALCLTVAGPTTAQERLAPDVLTKVKQATVRLRVTLPDSRVVQGSGFLGAEPGLVVTNAHVVGMRMRESRPPRRVDVIMHSGEKNERSLAAEVLGTDPDVDLALLRVKDKELPAPLVIGAAAGLKETQEVFIAGFPFGQELSKNVTIGKSSVSGLQKTGRGTVRRIQLNGGIQPGNSGGPVVDAQGRAVGIAMGVIDAKVHLAEPAEYITRLRNGRVVGLRLQPPYRDGEQLKIPAELEVVDPLARIRQASIELWTGNPGKPRPAGVVQPEPGDSAVQAVVLQREAGRIRGELSLDKLPAGKVYWHRPVIVNGAGETQRTAALVLEPLPALQRKPILLARKLRPGKPSSLALTWTANLLVDAPGGKVHSLKADYKVESTEELARAPDADGNALVRLRYQKVVGRTQLGERLLAGVEFEKSAPHLQLLRTDVTWDARSTIRESKTDDGQVPAEARPSVQDMAGQVVEMLDLTALPLPGREVAAGTTWQSRRKLLIPSTGRPTPAWADVTYRYLGVRAQGRAVIALDGDVRGRTEQGENLAGRIDGLAEVDPADGQLFSWSAALRVDVDSVLDKRPTRTWGTLEVALQRRPASE